MSLHEIAKKVSLPQSKNVKTSWRVSAADPIIYEAPEGRSVYYTRSYTGFYAYWFWVVFGTNEGASNVIFGDDGFAYINNPFGGWTTNSYLKCEVKDNKLIATLPQAIYEEDFERVDEETGETIVEHTDYFATLLYRVANEEGTAEYVMPDPEEEQTIS